MDTAVTTRTTIGTALNLCELGHYREARELDTFSDDPEWLLVRGVCAVYLDKDQSEARDLLTRAGRLLEGDYADRAWVYLTLSYFRAGELKEALVALPNPESHKTRFQSLHTRAMIETEQEHYDLAFSALTEASPYVDQVNSMWRGAFYNQRAMIHVRRDELDAAVLDYTASSVAFQEAEHLEHQAAVLNNLAGVLIKTGHYAEAHENLDRAEKIFRQNKWWAGLSKAKNYRARVLLAEGKPEAEQRSFEAVSLIEKTDRNGCLSEALITYSETLLANGKLTSALSQLDRATALGEYVGSDAQLFQIAKIRKQIALQLKDQAEISMIELAMKEGGSYRSVAKKAGYESHAGLIKAINRLGLTPKPPRLKSIIKRKL